MAKLDKLEWQADRIEAILASFGLQAQVFAGQVLPRVISYRVQLAQGQRVQAIEDLYRELALGLGITDIIVRQEAGWIAVEVPREKLKMLTLRQVIAGMKQAPPPHTALLGLSNAGCPLMLYMPSPDVAHVLVAGMTGSGKTELLRTMLTSLALWTRPRAAKFYLVDPQGRGNLADLGGLGSTMEYTQVDGAVFVLESLIVTMENRSRDGCCSPRVYLVIDELADLLLVAKEVEVALTRLVQRGRGVGIHIIASTQRPSAGILQGIMKANFPIRISGAVNSALEASITTGLPRSGAERLLGKGDMVLVHHGQVVRFQACLVSEGDIETLQYGSATAWLAAGKVNSRKETVGQVLARLRERLSIRAPGRPAKEPSEAMINFAISRLESDGQCTQRELRRWHVERYHTDVNPPRAAAAIREAQKRLGLRFA